MIFTKIFNIVDNQLLEKNIYDTIHTNSIAPSSIFTSFINNNLIIIENINNIDDNVSNYDNCNFTRTYSKGIAEYSDSNIDHLVIDIFNFDNINYHLVYGFNNNNSYQINYIKIDDPNNIDEIVNPSSLLLTTSNGTNN